MNYWNCVLIVYFTNICLWIGLLGYFLKRFRASIGYQRNPFLFLVITSLFLSIQEVYFFMTVSTNPSQAAILPVQWYPAVSELWIIPKILLTIIALSLIILILKVRGLETIFRPLGISVETYHAILEGLKKMFDDNTVAVFMYRSGKEVGRVLADRFSENGLKGKKLLEKILGYTVANQWSEKAEVLAFDPGKEVNIKIQKSFECTQSKGKISTCNLQRGVYAGACQFTAPNMICEGIEKRCESKRDPFCEFQIRFFKKAE